MDKVTKARQMSYPILKPYRDRRENKEQWCIAAVPGKAWAKKVFPGERTSVAMEKLWEAILTTSRVNEDPIKAWEAHNANIKKHCDYLNRLGIAKLHFEIGAHGGSWTWGMLIAPYYQTLTTTMPALRACVTKGIKEVIATISIIIALK